MFLAELPDLKRRLGDVLCKGGVILRNAYCTYDSIDFFHDDARRLRHLLAEFVAELDGRLKFEQQCLEDDVVSYRDTLAVQRELDGFALRLEQLRDAVFIADRAVREL